MGSSLAIRSLENNVHTESGEPILIDSSKVSEHG
jgi:hypothetical protein